MRSDMQLIAFLPAVCALCAFSDYFALYILMCTDHIAMHISMRHAV
jgi:hypothetical protein